MAIDLASEKCFKRPLPVDQMYRHPTTGRIVKNPRLGYPFVGPQAQAHLGIYDTKENLRAYARAPWAVVNQNLRRSLGRLIAQPSNNATQSWSVTAVTGTAYTFNLPGTNPWPLAGNPNFLTNSTLLQYGSGATAPTSADTTIQTQLGTNIVAATPVFDDSAFTATVSGSQVYPGAAATINEIAQTQNWYTSNGLLPAFLVDRTAITPGVALATNQTVAISYVWQF